MTTKERCLKALKNNAFFQSAMQKGKMICVTHTYEPWIVEEGFMFGNQYNAFDSTGKQERIYDTQLCCIFNDKRLKDFYVCNQGQGTYEECENKIDEYRSHVRKCKNCDGNGKKCFYWQCIGTIKSYEKDTDQDTVTKTTVYQYGCTYTKTDYSPTKSNCVYDIDETPRLCTEVWKQDYFIQHPEGIPDQTPLWRFLIGHADEFDICGRRWSSDPPSIDNGFQKNKLFGSYRFYADYWSKCFVLENSRRSFYFRYDVENDLFIIGKPHDIGYKTTRMFTESKYNYDRHTSVSKSIVGWDKFIQWWHSVIDAYCDEMITKEN